MITSRDNQYVKLVRALLTSKKARDEHGLFVLESPKAIAELDLSVVEFALKEAGESGCHSSEGWNPDENIRTLEVSSELWKWLSDTRSPQGQCAVVKKPVYALSAIRDGVVVVCDGIQDPGNAGTIIRTAAAFNASAVMSAPETVDFFSPKVARASAGALMKIPLIEQITPERLKEAGYTIVGLDLNAARDFRTIRRDKKVAIVFSHEGAGIRSSFFEAADVCVRIPHTPAVESLNVAVSAGIVLEWWYAGSDGPIAS